MIAILYVAKRRRVVGGPVVDPGDRVAFRDREMERHELVGAGDVHRVIVTVMMIVS